MTDSHKYGRDGENFEWTVASASDVLITIPTSGTESAIKIFLNKGSLASGFVLRPVSNVQIVRIGGQTFRSPITVTGGTVFAWTKNLVDFSEIVIRTLGINSHIKLLVL